MNNTPNIIDQVNMQRDMRLASSVDEQPRLRDVDGTKLGGSVERAKGRHDAPRAQRAKGRRDALRVQAQPFDIFSASPEGMALAGMADGSSSLPEGIVARTQDWLGWLRTLRLVRGRGAD
jgi:hypothetical protein